MLGVTETAGLQLVESLKYALRTRHLLLVLDNFEQVSIAARLVGEMLAASPRLKVLVTSRTPLHIYGEHEFVVPPLALPNPEHLPALDELAQCASVELLVARAHAVKPDFALTEANAPDVAAICARLNGLPLAIELAAARMKLFTPQALLARLAGTHRDSPLHLLAGGARDLPARQQTLRNAIAWSYDLLDAGGQALLRRLGVFVGGCTLEVIAAICNANGDLAMEIVEGMASLVDQSLLQQAAGANGEPRFRMLETIHEYALEQLTASAEAEALRQQHAAYYLALAERAEPQLRGPQQEIWLERLETEHDNLRAVLRRCNERGEIEQVARLSGALWWFWYLHGHWNEGRSWLEAALAHGHPLPTPMRAKLLLGAGWLVAFQGDFAKARTLLEESLNLCRDLGNPAGIADSLNGLGWVAFGQSDLMGARLLLEENLALCREHGYRQGSARALYLVGFIARLQGDDAVARAMYQESLGLYRELRDKGGIAGSLWGLGFVSVNQGDATLAAPLLEESLALYQECGEKLGISSALNGLGHVAEVQSNYQRAVALFERSLALRREMGDPRGSSAILNNLGRVVLAQGDIARATILFEESLTLCRDLEHKVGSADVLPWLGTVASRSGQLERAARLWGAAEALHEAINYARSPLDQVCDDRDIAAARAQLDDASFAAAWAAGRAMTLDQAIAYALGEHGGLTR